jgi:hypothetical protein
MIDWFKGLLNNSNKEPAYHIGFSWTDFQTSEKLENVKIQLSEIIYSRKQGTKIIISDLMEPELWQDAKNNTDNKETKNKSGAVVERLKTELSQVISPYKEIREFTVYIEIDGKVIDLVEINDALRNNASLQYKFNFDGDHLLIFGKTTLDYFKPSKNQNKENDLNFFNTVIKNDNGKSFYNYLKNQNFALQYNIKFSKSKKWFVEFSNVIYLM